METWIVGFCGGRKTGERGVKPSEQGQENQQQTQPTCDAGSRNRTWATTVGRLSLHMNQVQGTMKVLSDSLWLVE